MAEEKRIIDVWMQHPNPEFSKHPIFESLRRWTGMERLTEPIPIELTLDAMDQGAVCASDCSPPGGDLPGL